MRRAAIMTAGLALLLALGPMVGHGQDPKRVNEFMRQKLVHSQKVLEGLTLENHELVARSAEALAQLSQAASWQVLQTPEYARYSADFQRLAERLQKMGQEKNTEGATLAYVEMTINCVNCHKYVRSTRTAGLDRPGDSLR